MADNYQVPIDGNWDVKDMVAVSNLVDAVLQVYEGGCDRNLLIENYRLFSEVIPSKSEQKKFDRDFEAQTGHSIYRTMQLTKNGNNRVIVRA